MTDILALAQQALVMADLAARPDMTHRLAAPSPWLRGRLAVVRKPDGTWRQCRHVKPGEARWLLTWAPRQLVCHRCCFALSKAIRGTTDDRVCDVCGVTAAGVYPFVAPAPDAITVTGGACCRCRSVVSAGWGDDAEVTP